MGGHDRWGQRSILGWSPACTAVSGETGFTVIGIYRSLGSACHFLAHSLRHSRWEKFLCKARTGWITFKYLWRGARVPTHREVRVVPSCESGTRRRKTRKFAPQVLPSHTTTMPTTPSLCSRDRILYLELFTHNSNFVFPFSTRGRFQT